MARREESGLAGGAEYTDVVTQMKALLKQVHPAPVTGGKAEPNLAVVDVEDPRVQVATLPGMKPYAMFGLAFGRKA